jgi:hypothetical protein
MTNAEYIRNMSDEKLAAWLWNHMGHDVFCGEMCADKQSHTWCWEPPSVEKCADKILEWLRQEHEE